MATEPIFETQLDEYGNPEKVDVSKYMYMVTCDCGNVRYVMSQDRTQVTKCKPCAQEHKRIKKKVLERARRRRNAAKKNANTQ